MSESSAPEPAFRIGSIPVYGRLILSPMDGISDPPFRWITRRLGSALSISEFINTLDYANQKHYQVSRLSFRAAERPFGVQLLDNDPFRMADCAAEIYSEYQPDFFDVNLGCCTASVTSRGAGAGMLRTPAKVAQAFQELSKAVPVPLTAKLRLGWDEDSLNYRQIAEIAVENGACVIALHGRTAKMAYTGKARWQPIAELKASLPVPVIGNGDVTSPTRAHQIFAQTGCDAAMVGRAAKANPFIFSWRDRSEVSPEEIYGLIRYQLEAMQAFHPAGALLPFRKFLKAYLEPYALPKEQLRALLTSGEEAELLRLIDQVFPAQGVMDLAGAEQDFRNRMHE
ncbi:MAG TPA: tRNA-dihydrouridine synthase family protein [Anaerolineaceae bacterium]|jgi:nifR3 family TIM-barrel protein|nr:tRNA-dihydrouridine synthase family protein [Anaerolineaceae bacterium]HPS33178.1 tRNA-dihydrouridine synthase family protein [Anaerolineaceae bacterium]